MPPNHFESEVESFLEGSHGDRTHIKRADHHTVTPLCGTLLSGDHDHRHRSHNPRRPHTTHQSGRRPPAPPQARTTGSQRDKTLPAQHISRSNGTKFSLLVVKRSFWPVLRMQGEFYPGYDIHGPQQGEFYPGILVAHGPHPGSAMIIHVLLARQRP